MAIGLFAGPTGVRADFLTTGIIIDQTILMPTGDPQFQLDFHASLAGRNALSTGASTMTSPDFILFRDIPDYASASFTSSNFGNNLFSISTTQGSATSLTNVLFTYKVPLDLANTSASGVALGDFLIATTDNYDPAKVPPQLTGSFVYMTQTTSTIPPNGKNLGTGLTPAAVPEPASVLLVAAGLSLAVVRARRRPIA